MGTIPSLTAGQQKATGGWVPAQLLLAALGFFLVRFGAAAAGVQRDPSGRKDRRITNVRGAVGTLQRLTVD
ncbi:hypothetical protein DFJ73DRAFT_859157 [Zopfochytrium polystomum]|nr:hypothetical protein DFJ73DRAFT_859157 [Zopfochytrium polystomum]